ncbi:hypothetical protein AX774_g3492 [Zancudomyces culisetae]|uniref:GST N-terminal domain-containing protein n=1 Tax=Zancudomyces culisetae TaxID=1213189 RepID=A0A1R1PPV9_ZANCU|nr:hypothetical protein AX774_g3492 [Zancudomyces culisetae]|eukprot:OMH83004.1 hypothetical protein AX774_g3492 [Zancudomyces culisetae]
MKVNQADLYIIDYKYSSWSMRGWLVLKLAGVDFKLHHFLSNKPDFPEKVLKASPSKKVPTVHLTVEGIEEPVIVWDSLSITEWACEFSKQFGLTTNKLWPEFWLDRAIARSAVSEMHSGFMALRDKFPFNVLTQREFKEKWRVAQVDTDVSRITALWSECRAQFEATRGNARYGPQAQGNVRDDGYLFGEFGIVDAFFAPIVFRIKNYSLSVTDEYSLKYIKLITDNELVKEWVACAIEEDDYIEEFEAPFK